MALSAALSAALMSGACSNAPQQPASDTSQDPALKEALRKYTVEFLRRNPTTNTYLGGSGLDPSLHDVDGALRDYSPAALDAENAWLKETSATIDEFESVRLSASARIDRDVALAQIRFMLRQNQERRYQERALDTYVGEPFRALDWQLQGMSGTGQDTYGTADEWTLVVSRLRAIPRYLDTARAQIEAGIKANRTPDRRMLERDGLDTAEANAKYFAQTLPALARTRIGGPDRARLLADVTTAGKAASDAYLAFRQFVLSTFFDDNKPPAVRASYMPDRFAMGEDDYNWALKNNLRVDKTAVELFEEATPIVDKTRAQMVALARAIGTTHGWTLAEDGPAAVRQVFNELSKDYPKSDAEMIAWYREAAFRLVDYARKTHIFDVPADYKLDVVETPPPLQASIDGAAYYPAPPFKNSGVGRFYVTPTGNNKAALQSNNRAALADLAAHEGFPGHDWYFKVLTSVRNEVSPVRWLTPGAVEDSSSMWEDSMPAEGWGLYAESLMAEPQPGAPDGFYTPEEHLYQLQGQLYRDLRVRIDTGLHTRRLSYEAAVTLFSEVVDFLPGSCAAPDENATKQASCDAAERAIFRYSKWPTQAVTYRLGKDQIYAMREEAVMMLGSAFSEQAFHLLYIKQGTIPPGYFRDFVLNELAPTR